MIAGGMCRHAVSRRGIIQNKYSIRCSTRFERTDLLKILALKKEGRTARLIQSRAR